jgi:predicted enzyme related to lactoylglutathione lyase
MFLGLRTAVYHTPDLDRAKTWYAHLLETEPYFAEPFYVGFNIGGYELGLVPDSEYGPPGPGGSAAFWGVAYADVAYKRLLERGAKSHSAVKDVGGGIKVATVLDPFGNIIGIIENPNFKLPS